MNWHIIFLLGVVNNIGQYPLGKADAYSFLSTGPLCRYAGDLLPMFKLIALPEHTTKLRLNEQVSTPSVALYTDITTRCSIKKGTTLFSTITLAFLGRFL